MYVAENSSARHAHPSFAIRRANEARGVQVLGRHVDLQLVVAPRIAGTVGVDLDPEPVRIREINRFAYCVIGHSGAYAYIGEVRNEPPKRCPVREQNREVIKSEQPAPRYWTRRGVSSQLDDGAIVIMRTQRRAVGGPSDRPQPDHTLVEKNRPIEIRDLKTDLAEPGLLRKSVVARPDSARGGHIRVSRNAHDCLPRRSSREC